VRNNDQAADIELTIIITVVSGKTALRRCLDALCQDFDFSEGEIIVPYDKWSSDIGELSDEFPNVRFHFINDLGVASSERISSHRHRLYDRRRAVGLERARGRIIAMTEDHVVPATDWCQQILEAHKQPYAVIGGAIDNALDNPLNWAVYYCDFGRYGSPLESGPAEYVSDVNLAYKRDVLQAVGEVWKDAYHETTVHWALRSRGEVLFRDPRLTVYQHRQLPSIWQLCKERVEWGRIFAETRVAECSLKKRLLYALGTPLLPPLLMARLVRHTLRQQRSAKQIVLLAPLAACLLISWSLGELLGYIKGEPLLDNSLTATIPQVEQSGK
jgi:hypothetical protein